MPDEAAPDPGENEGLAPFFLNTLLEQFHLSLLVGLVGRGRATTPSPLWQWGQFPILYQRVAFAQLGDPRCKVRGDKSPGACPERSLDYSGKLYKVYV
jgi:hypothetical protein